MAHCCAPKRRWWHRLCRHGGPAGFGASGHPVALVGSPDVGKSRAFDAPTGLYAVVSHYLRTAVAASNWPPGSEPRNKPIYEGIRFTGT